MGAALAIAAAVPRSGTRARNGGGTDSKPSKGPQKPGKHLLNKSDVTAAVAWRLDGIPSAEVATLATMLRPFAGDFREARPEVARLLADMRRPGDRRGLGRWPVRFWLGTPGGVVMWSFCCWPASKW
jgi:hypothetical protein